MISSSCIEAVAGARAAGEMPFVVDRTLYSHRPRPPPPPIALNPAARFFKASGSVGLHGITSSSSVRSMSAHATYDPDAWLLDSGCSRHMTGDRNLFTTFEEEYSGAFVRFGAGTRSPVIGEGEIKFPGIGELKNVQYVEGLVGNILSISQFCNDFQVHFNRHVCFITNKQDECVLKGTRSGDMYVIYPNPLFLMVPSGFLVTEGEEEVSFVKVSTNAMEEEEEEEEEVVEPEDDDYDNSTTNDYYDLLSVKGKKLVLLKKKVEKKSVWCPWERDLADYPICFGSSRGWLAFIHPRSCSIYLYSPIIIKDNPFHYIPLPPIETLPSVRRRISKKSSSSSLNSNKIATEYMIPQKKSAVSPEQLSEDFFKKIVCSTPGPYNFTVMTIQGYQSHQLAFCRIIDRSWTALQGTLDPYRDIVYSSEHQLFYALGCGGLEAWDLGNPDS